MNQWLAKLSLRERILLIGGAVVLFISGLYAFTYLPIVEGQQRLTLAIDAQQQLKTYLQSIGAEVVQLQQNAPQQPDSVDSSQSQMSIIDTSSEEAGVKPAIKRLVPEGQDQVTLWLEHCDFDKLIYWLATLDTQHAIHVKQLNISRDTAAGLVSGKVLLGS